VGTSPPFNAGSKTFPGAHREMMLMNDKSVLPCNKAPKIERSLAIKIIVLAGFTFVEKLGIKSARYGVALIHPWRNRRENNDMR
jgi:hypothetical protein